VGPRRYRSGYFIDLGVGVMSEESIQSYDTVDESAWPLLKSERNWGQFQLWIVLLVAASATWCYIIGEYVGYYLDMKMGAAAMIAGSMIGMFLVTLAVVPSATRYGIDSISSSKPQFGNKGWIITVFLQYVSIIGWNSLLLIFFGKSVAQLLTAMGITGEESGAMVVPIATPSPASACIWSYSKARRASNGSPRSCSCSSSALASG
jgi:NCS1 family nucleobase:cation symporter-1